MKILCAGYLFREALGGLTWHHLQYLLGFERLGHEVAFVEHFGWENSCYDAARDTMGDDADYGLAYVQKVFKRTGFSGRWCYLAADGTAHGMSRDELAHLCRECDVFFNLSNINWIDEFQLCRRRALVDTDPVFTQIGGHGMGGSFSNYRTLFSYGENVGVDGCDMPTAGEHWLPTRQPIVLDLWPVEPANAGAPLTTLINWTAYGDVTFQGQVYGQKDREFSRFLSLPKQTGAKMEVAANAPNGIKDHFRQEGWMLGDALAISRDPWTYQSYLARSKGEFCVAKHGYVTTQCGWFSDRSAAYLAMGRPVILQDTGFSKLFPCGKGLLAYEDVAQAAAAIHAVAQELPAHSRAARKIAEEHFDARRVLNELLERAM